jgi:hypothetical protein
MFGKKLNDNQLDNGSFHANLATLLFAMEGSSKIRAQGAYHDWLDMMGKQNENWRDLDQEADSTEYLQKVLDLLRAESLTYQLPDVVAELFGRGGVCSQ